MSFSDYLENAILTATLKGGTFPSLTGTLYLGVGTSAIDEAYAGATNYAATELDATTDISYARQAVTFGTVTDETGADGKQLANDAIINFPQAGSNWGTISHYGVFTAATGGQLLYHGALTTSQIIQQHGILQVPVGGAAIIVR